MPLYINKDELNYLIRLLGEEECYSIADTDPNVNISDLKQKLEKEKDAITRSATK